MRRRGGTSPPHPPTLTSRQRRDGIGRTYDFGHLGRLLSSSSSLKQVCGVIGRCVQHQKSAIRNNFATKAPPAARLESTRGESGPYGTSLIALAAAISTADGTVDTTHEVREVKEGEVAILPCLSQDGEHRFLYWQFDPNVMIGPEYQVNETKYKYEVLTGTLKIRNVRKTEEGVYRCTSQNLNDHVNSIHPVKLIVNKNWEEVWETDHETNLLRGWISFLVVGILLVGAYFVYRYRRRPSSRFREVPDEEIAEDIMAGVELTAPSTSLIGDGDNISMVDTDFPKAFNAMYKPIGGVEARL